MLRLLPQGAAMPAVFWEYVLSPTRSGVLTALDFVLRTSSSSTTTSTASSGGKVPAGGGAAVFDQLNAVQREALRHYLATAEPVKHLSGMNK